QQYLFCHSAVETKRTTRGVPLIQIQTWGEPVDCKEAAALSIVPLPGVSREDWRSKLAPAKKETKNARVNLIRRRFGGGPAEDDPDLRGAFVFGAGHDKGLAVGADVISIHGAAAIELTVE